jgi:hypothetical protein
MKIRLESRLKKLEAKSPREPIKVAIIQFGTMPDPEVAARAIAQARTRGIALEFVQEAGFTRDQVH